MGADHEGIDAEGITEWLRGRVDEVAPPLEFEVVEGGRSNLTFRMTDGEGRAWALRRPPLHGVLESAHDMQREYKIMSALADSGVPVPRMYGYEKDDSVTGAEFFVMDFVEGKVLRDEDDAHKEFDEEGRGRAAENLVDVLVALHEPDPDDLGLGDLGPRDNYLERQLKRWHKQLEQIRERELPLLDEVQEMLLADIPEQRSVSVVHGDYRLDNLILSPDGEVRAVLDWELCTLGDPIADIAMTATYWSDPDDDFVPLLSSPTVVEGFPNRREIVQLYAERSGRDIDDFDYYYAFGNWRLAAILEGVYARYQKGACGDTDDESYQQFADIVIKLGERAKEAAERAGR